jgi:aspartate carbamoyltransferase catalytic subunit
MIRHYLSLANFTRPQLLALVERANFFSLHQHQPQKISTLLKHKIFANIFYEPSTRTRCSFEVAAKRLGAEVINFIPENSSVKKGESIYDTLKSLESLGVEGLILRHSDDHIFEELMPKFQTPLINAGAGKFEHPSQGLLDLLTLKQEFGKLENLKIAICGDIKHSRVAGSMIVAAEKLGMEIFFSGPEMLMPNKSKVSPIDEVLPKVDAVMMLRIQLERHESLEINSLEYHRKYGLNLKRVESMKKDAIIMHPGPFNRGIEIADEVVEHEKSRIFKQVNNGVSARMAILDWVINGENNEAN